MTSEGGGGGRRPAAGADLSVLIIAPHFDPGYRAGGVLRSLVAGVQQSPDRVTCSVITGDRDLGATAPYDGVPTQVWTSWHGRHRAWYGSPSITGLWAMVRAGRTGRYDILYINTLWSIRYAWLPMLLSAVGVWRCRTTLVAPRGQLSPGALRISAGRKRVVLAAWRLAAKVLRFAWHASSDEEAVQCLAVGPQCRVIVSLDPVDLPMTPAEPHASPDVPTVVYASRITPKKNLLLALEALAQVGIPLNLEIVGPVDDEAYWQGCERQIASFGPDLQVEVVGAVAPEQVRERFRSADLFLFPTSGENFGHVIAESLSAACPVAAGRDTPWTAVLGAGGGLVIESMVAGDIAAAVQQFLRRDHSGRLASSARAAQAYRAWISSRPRDCVFEQV